MPVTAVPIFVQTPKVLGMAQISTANTGRDGSGTLGTVFTGSANGDTVDHIDIVATGTTTAGVVRLFISDGTNIRLWKEILVSAITPSATVQVFSSNVDCSLPSNALFIQSTWLLRCSTHNAETFNVIAHGGSY